MWYTIFYHGSELTLLDIVDDTTNETQKLIHLYSSMIPLATKSKLTIDEDNMIYIKVRCLVVLKSHCKLHKILSTQKTPPSIEPTLFPNPILVIIMSGIKISLKKESKTKKLIVNNSQQTDELSEQQKKLITSYSTEDKTTHKDETKPIIVLKQPCKSMLQKEIEIDEKPILPYGVTTFEKVELQNNQ